jgi:drug/metabolite transporter (DMT)-like permease
MVPFSAMIFATVLLGEPMTASTIIGGLIGITSVYLLNQDV